MEVPYFPDPAFLSPPEYYASGKLIIIGCKTPDDAKAALQKILYHLHDIGLL